MRPLDLLEHGARVEGGHVPQVSFGNKLPPVQRRSWPLRPRTLHPSCRQGVWLWRLRPREHRGSPDETDGAPAADQVCADYREGQCDQDDPLKRQHHANANADGAISADARILGQIIIPKSVRTKIKLVAGNRVEFIETEGGFLVKPATRDIRGWWL